MKSFHLITSSIISGKLTNVLMFSDPAQPQTHCNVILTRFLAPIFYNITIKRKTWIIFHFSSIYSIKVFRFKQKTLKFSYCFFFFYLFFFQKFCARDFLKTMRPSLTIFSQMIDCDHNSRRVLQFWNHHVRIRFTADFVCFYDQLCANYQWYNYQIFWICRQ